MPISELAENHAHEVGVEPAGEAVSMVPEVALQGEMTARAQRE